MDAAGTRAGGRRRSWARALRRGKTPWVWVQTVRPFSARRATAQEGPIAPCVLECGARVAGGEAPGGRGRGIRPGEGAGMSRGGERADEGGDLEFVRERCRFLPFGGGGECPHGLDRLELAGGRDREVAPFADDFDDARQAGDGFGVCAKEDGAGARLADGAGVQHAGKAEVLDEGGAAGELGREVDARH